jgi:eight-cysteine-cluster-containing protein
MDVVAEKQRMIVKGSGGGFLCIIVLIIVLLSGCGGPGPAAPRTSLVLSASNGYGPAPLEVSFHAEVRNQKDPARFYCRDYRWDFGDGTAYAESPICGPLDNMSDVPLVYDVDHIYREKGSYMVVFTIGDVVSNPITITVKENLPSSYTESCVSDADCGTGGCSGEICGFRDKVRGIMTTCAVPSSYRCYKVTSCGCVDGRCQWKPTQDFLSCMGAIRS